MTELRGGRRRSQRAAGPPQDAPQTPASTGDQPTPGRYPAANPDLTPGHAAGCRRPPPWPVWWAAPSGAFLPLWRCLSCGAAWPRGGP